MRRRRVCYINGIPYLVQLPSGGYMPNSFQNQWDQLIDCLDQQDKALNSVYWKDIYSWCREKNDQSICVVRGNSSPIFWNSYSANIRKKIIGFRPAFIPLNPITLQRDPSVLEELSDGQCVSFGSFYLDKKIMRPPQKPTREGDIPDYIPGADISFGSLKSDYGFKAIKVNGWLIADRVLIKNISWNDLKVLGYVN